MTLGFPWVRRPSKESDEEPWNPEDEDVPSKSSPVGRRANSRSTSVDAFPGAEKRRVIVVNVQAATPRDAVGPVVTEDLVRSSVTGLKIHLEETRWKTLQKSPSKMLFEPGRKTSDRNVLLVAYKSNDSDSMEYTERLEIAGAQVTKIERKIPASTARRRLAAKAVVTKKRKKGKKRKFKSD